MATTRLRKTFHYPTDSDSDSPDELDEQSQETLITTLTASDERTTSFYRHAFLPLPLLSVLLYIPSIILPSSFRAFLVAVLSVSCLGLTSWILYYLPLPKEKDTKGKRALYLGDPRGPVERYIIPLVGALSAVLALVAVGAWRRGLLDQFWKGVLPGGMFTFPLLYFISLDICGGLVKSGADLGE